MMETIHFITFGDGPIPLRHASRRLKRQATQSKLFSSVTALDLTQLIQRYPEFWARYSQFILQNRRGCGYWCWKPFILLQQLSQIEEGEYLVYADAGCEISDQAKGNLVEFLPTNAGEHLTATVLEPIYSVAAWTNAYCRRMLDEDNCFEKHAQIQSGLLGIKNCAESRSLLELWTFWCMYKSGSCIIDRYNEEESPNFVEHRHDQSVLTLLIYNLEKKEKLRCKRWSANEAEELDFVIPTLRNRSPFSRLHHRGLITRLSERVYYKALRIIQLEERRRAKLARLATFLESARESGRLS